MTRGACSLSLCLALSQDVAKRAMEDMQKAVLARVRANSNAVLCKYRLGMEPSLDTPTFKMVEDAEPKALLQPKGASAQA